MKKVQTYLEIQQVKYYEIPRGSLNIDTIKTYIKCRALRPIIFYDLSHGDAQRPNRFLRTCSYRRMNPPDQRLNFLKHSNDRSRIHARTREELDKSVAPTISVCCNACARRQSPVRMQVGRPITRGPPTRAQCERNRHRR